MCSEKSNWQMATINLFQSLLLILSYKRTQKLINMLTLFLLTTTNVSFGCSISEVKAVMLVYSHITVIH